MPIEDLLRVVIFLERNLRRGEDTIKLEQTNNIRAAQYLCENGILHKINKHSKGFYFKINYE